MSKLSSANDKARDDRVAELAVVAPDFAELFAQLNTPSDCRMVDGGYSELMARIISPTYRRRIGDD